MKKGIESIAVTFLLLSYFCSNAQLIILSGTERATYHQLADDIISVVSEKYDLGLVNEASAGSVQTFYLITDPNSPYKIGFMQSDVLYAMQGLDLKDGTRKTDDIKVIMPLAYEQIHVITKESSGITTLQDLEKKRLAIGSKGQGSYFTANFIKDRTGISWKSYNTPFEEYINELMFDRIDAFLYIGSSPIEKFNISPEVMRNKIVLLALENYKDWAKYYTKDVIKADDYKWLDQDVPTYSVKTVMVVNEAKLSDAEREVVTRLQSGILNQFDQLKSQGHAQWKKIDPASWSDSDWPMFR